MVVASLLEAGEQGEGWRDNGEWAQEFAWTGGITSVLWHSCQLWLTIINYIFRKSSREDFECPQHKERINIEVTNVSFILIIIYCIHVLKCHTALHIYIQLPWAPKPNK
jgi:hypothetical protein